MSSFDQINAFNRLLAGLRTPKPYQTAAANLPAPSIPTAEQNGGIREQDLYDPTVPLLVLIRAYSQMGLNDSIAVFWNNDPVATGLVEQEHIEGGSIIIPVPSIGIADGLAQVRYLVTSANGGNQYPSDILEIRVKTNVPGGGDPDPSTPVNERLKPVSGVPDTINEGNVNSIIATLAPYLNMTGDDLSGKIKGDRVVISFNGEMVDTHTVSEGEVGNPVSIAIPRSVIERTGSGDALIRYEIRDTVNNWSRWSLGFTTYVEIDDDLLPLPLADDVVDNKLDLIKLGDKEPYVLVRSYRGMEVDDQVRLHWFAHGGSDREINHTIDFDITEDNFGLPIEFWVPNYIATASANSQVALRYTVNPGINERLSKRLIFDVIGQPQNLAAPRIQEAQGERLEVERIPDEGATAIVNEYPGMAEKDRLELFVIADDERSHYECVDIDDTQVGVPIHFTISKAFLEGLLDHTITVLYRVNSTPSDSLLLHIVSQEGTRLTAPEVEKMDAAGVLDPRDVPNGTQAFVLNYEGKSIDDEITFEWIGVEHFDANVAVTAENLDSKIGFDIKYDPYVIGNLDTEVTAQYRVQRADGSLAASMPLLVNVQYKSTDVFPMPSVLETQADGKTLYPLDATKGATVRAHYPDMVETDRLFVTWLSKNSIPYRTEEKQGHEDGTVNFTIPFHIVANSADAPATVFYTVIRSTIETPSELRQLEVMPLPNFYFENFEASPIGDESIYDLASIVIRRNGGKMGIDLHTNIPFTDNKALYFTHSISITLKADATVVTFGYSGETIADTDIYCYDRDNNPVSYEHLPNQPGFMTLTSGAQMIHTISFLSSRTLFLDNIAFL